MITPLINQAGSITHLHLTVDTLPGLRLVIDADAAGELRDALAAILGAARPTASEDRIVQELYQRYGSLCPGCGGTPDDGPPSCDTCGRK